MMRQQGLGGCRRPGSRSHPHCLSQGHILQPCCLQILSQHRVQILKGWAQAWSRSLWADEGPGRQPHGSWPGPQGNLPQRRARLRADKAAGDKAGFNPSWNSTGASRLWKILSLPSLLEGTESLHHRCLGRFLQVIKQNPAKEVFICCQPVPYQEQPGLLNTPVSGVCFRDQSWDISAQEGVHNLSRCSKEPND